MKSRLLLGAAALCMAPSLAFAQEAGRSNPSETIVVIGQRPADYSPSDASSGTRIDAPLLETPLSVRVVDATVIADRAISEPRELAETVAGVQNVAGYGNTPSQWYIIRGFSTAGVNYRDGYRSAEIYTPRDFANVERVEFVMGPQSVLYGQSQPAGAVNTITKTPFDGALTSAEVRLGSFETLRGSLDLNRSYGPLSFRLNAMAENADSYVDYEQTDAYLVAPSLRLQISDNIELFYSGEYQKTTIDGFSNGLPMAVGVFDLPASATVSEPWARLENETISHRLEARIRLSDDCVVGFEFDYFHVAERLAQKRFIIHVFGNRRAAGLVGQLFRAISLQKKEPVGLQALLHARKHLVAKRRRRELNEDSDDGVIALMGPIPLGQIGALKFKRHAALDGERLGFGEGHDGGVHGMDVQPLFGQPDAVAAFAVSDGQRAPPALEA